MMNTQTVAADYVKRSAYNNQETTQLYKDFVKNHGAL